MNKFKEIRPVVLGIAKKNNKILVSEGYDKIKNQTFYRCLGGGIEFLETSQKALKREFKEELGIDIEVGEYCGIAENIFTFQGKDGHEIIFFYNIKIREEDYKEKFPMIDDDGEGEAIWVDIDEFKNNKKILYPKEIFKYL
ncbi:MAG: NUDIX domain-containing protein [Clostridia bacterium]|nr:NUDIX domain-containing protein [Clostridia bacterium]